MNACSRAKLVVLIIILFYSFLREETFVVGRCQVMLYFVMLSDYIPYTLGLFLVVLLWKRMMESQSARCDN